MAAPGNFRQKRRINPGTIGLIPIFGIRKSVYFADFGRKTSASSVEPLAPLQLFQNWMYGRISFALKTTILLLGIRQKNIALIGIKTGTEFFHHLTGLMGIKVSVEIIADLADSSLGLFNLHSDFI